MQMSPCHDIIASLILVTSDTDGLCVNYGWATVLLELISLHLKIGGGVRTLLRILTPFMTKIVDFPPTLFMTGAQIRYIVYDSLKPWPNGAASRRKFSTCVYFGHPTQVNASWESPYYQPMKYRICLPWNGFLRFLCTCEETCKSVWPPNLYANSTCGCSRLLASPFDQGIRLGWKNHTPFKTKMAKIDTPFLSKMAEKPYPLRPHRPI